MINFNKDLKSIDINIDEAEVASQLSFTDSDLHEFQKMEKDIYGDDFENDSDEEIEEYDHDNNEVTDEHTESIEIIRPEILNKPCLGDAISTYDKLQVRYSGNFDEDNFTENYKSEIESRIQKPQISSTSPVKSRASSRESDRSAETVLSQNEENNDLSDNEYLSDNDDYDRDNSKTPTAMSNIPEEETEEDRKLKMKLAHETAKRMEQDKYIEHLNMSIQQLQSKHALAEETIDQLRLGVLINVPKGGDDSRSITNKTRMRRRNTMTTTNRYQNKMGGSVRGMDDANRRYSSIITSSSDLNGLGPLDRELFNKTPTGKIVRARSVEFGEYNENLETDSFTRTNSKNDDSKGFLTPTNDIDKLTEQFQTRAEVVEQEIQNLNINMDYVSSSSSSSPFYHNVRLRKPHMQRHKQYQGIKDRLSNIQSAYQNLSKDFNDCQSKWKRKRQDTELQPYLDFKDQVEGQLFSLSMQLDTLEHKINEHSDEFESKTEDERKQELLGRLEDLEMQYDGLLDRYSRVKQFGVEGRANKAREIGELVQQLEDVVKDAQGCSRNIPVNVSQLHMILDAPNVSDDQDRPLSSNSVHSSNNWRVKPIDRQVITPSNDSSLEMRSSMPEFSGGRLSPIKSRRSSRSVNGNSQRLEEANKMANESQPNSVVSSGSMWRGATSGETLQLDENGLLKDPPLYHSTPKSMDKMSIYSNNPRDRYINSRNSMANGDDDLSKRLSYPRSIQNLDDEVRSLDHHLAMAEIENKREIHYSETGGSSHNTRSLLGTSPTNSNISRLSKGRQSGASSNKSSGKGIRSNLSFKDSSPTSQPQTPSYKAKRSNRQPSHSYSLSQKLVSSQSAPSTGSSSASSGSPLPKANNDFYRHNHHQQKQKYSTSSESELSDNSIDDVIQYAEAAQSGLGNRSRYIRQKGPEYQDKWCQTPKKINRKSSNTTRKQYSPLNGDRIISPSYDPDYYQDNVDYWDGDKFHPAREHLPGKSILRQQRHKDKSRPKSSRSNHPIDRRNNNRNSYAFSDDREFPGGPWQPPNETNSVRQYSNIGPHRYFVREYGNRMRQSSQPIPFDNNYEDNNSGLSDEDMYSGDNDDDYVNYQNYVEGQRISRYLDEAIRAARTMKQYSRQLNETVNRNSQVPTIPRYGRPSNNTSQPQWNPIDLSYVQPINNHYSRNYRPMRDIYS